MNKSDVVCLLVMIERLSESSCARWLRRLGFALPKGGRTFLVQLNDECKLWTEALISHLNIQLSRVFAEDHGLDVALQLAQMPSTSC
jgi:hypothetical protein